MKLPSLSGVAERISPAVIAIISCMFFLENLIFRKSHSARNFFLRRYYDWMKVNYGVAPYSHELPYLYRRGNMTIHDYCSFGEGTKFWNFCHIQIDDDFMAAAGLQILTGSHDPDTMVPSAMPVKIGKRVWCGANVTIMPGVTIGDDAVIGANSLVVKNVPSGEIWAGNPAKYIRNVDLARRSEKFFSVRSLLEAAD